MAGLLHLRHHDGREIAVAPADFKKGADAEYKGFRVLGYEDGTAWEGPRTAAEVVREKEAASPAKAAPKADSKHNGE